jgi:RHS repeat-associated protein
VLTSLVANGGPFAAVIMVCIATPLLLPARAAAATESTGDRAEFPTEAVETDDLAAELKSAPQPRDRWQDELLPSSKRKPGTLSGAEPASAVPGVSEVETKEAVAPAGTVDKSGASSQAINVPKGAGTLQGMGESFSAQISTGIASFSLPFSLPPARGGAQPSLALSYSSASGSGVAGVGWDASVPFIARQTDRGTPRYDDRADYWVGQDRFVYNGGQELVPICTVGGTSASLTCASALPGEEMPTWSLGSQYFRPRVEGSFLRFFWSPNHQTWRVQDKSGVTMEFGVPLDGSNYRGGLLVNPENGKVARWGLVRQYDTQGAANPLTAETNPAPNNVVIYRYHPAEPALLLTDIYDTSPAAAPTSSDPSKFAHHTRLHYEERPDPSTSYNWGFKLQRQLRLKRVDVTSSTFNFGTTRLRQQLRRYHLSYEGDLRTSLLSSVQLEGRCGGSEDFENQAPSEQPDGSLRDSSCPRLPAMTFEYTHVSPFSIAGGATSSSLQGYEGFDERVREITGSPDRSVDQAEADFFDLDGDALPDFLVTGPAAFGGGFGQFLNAPGGAADAFGKAAVLPMLGGASAGALRLNNANVAILDLDGDARVDLINAPGRKTYEVYSLRSSGLSGRSITAAKGDSIKINFANALEPTRVLDVNGDGLVDVVVTTGTEMQTFFALGRTPGGKDRFGRVDDGIDISAEPVRTCLPYAARSVSFSDPEIQLADMNGDGLTDIVKLQHGKVRYWPGRGNGVWGTGAVADCSRGNRAKIDVLMTSSPQLIDASGLRLDDINGDGLDDLVKVRGTHVEIWLNVNGTSWTSSHVIEGTPPSPDFTDRVRLLDVNGSGTRDIVWGEAGRFKYIDLLGGRRPWLLKGIANGLGKTTAIEYASSTEEMLAAERLGGTCSSTDWARPWCKKMPIVTHLVKRVTESDNLAFAGLPANAIVTEYQYRDPVYDGRQREFRGFERARSKAVGDATGPTSYAESQFLLGECVFEQNGMPPCDDASADNPREALKGLPVVSEQYDEAGVYLSTKAMTYRLRRLYVGRDGREVRHAFQVGTRTTAFDTAAGPASGGTVANFNAVELETTADATFNPVTTPKGLPAGLTFESLPLPVRANAGTGTLETRLHVDYFGNQVVAVSLGCTSGAACPGATATTGLDPNQAIYSFTLPGRPTNDVTRWLWRTVETSTAGDYRPSVLHRTLITYDTRGNPLTVRKVLSGTLALLRSHRTLTGTGVTAAAPTGASTNGTKTVATNTYDPNFGNLTQTTGPNGRCRKLTYDGATLGYQQLVTTEQVFTTPSCTGASLTTAGAYDRGHALPTVVVDASFQPLYVSYDHFGRLVSLKRPLPDGTTPDVSTIQPSLTVTYGLATPDRPYSTIETNVQDSAAVSTAAYRWNVAVVDGMGRTRLSRSEADKTGGRDVQNVVEDAFVMLNAKGAVVRKYLPRFANVTKTSPLPASFSARFGRVEYDAFGRVVRAYDLATNTSGIQTVLNKYHALSEDIYDAADIGLDTGQAHKDTHATTRRDGHGRTIVTTERVKVGGVLDERDVRLMYQTSGELIAITRVHVGSTDPTLVRWMRYDTLGRLVMNVDPHVTKNFNANVTTNPSSTGMRPWLYAYNDAGDLVGTSDARGCGANYTYDADGRLVTEDYSPCEADHAPYSPPDLATHAGIEVRYQYDSIPSSFSTVVGVPVGSSGSGLPNGYDASSPFLNGRLAAVFDRSGLQVLTYDARGRGTRLDRRLADPDGSIVDPRLKYRGRWYSSSTGYDAEDRVVAQSTGASSAEFLVGGKSELTMEYSARGVTKRVAGSYGELVSSVKHSAEGLIQEVVYGDAAKTTAFQTYDTRNRLATSQVTRSIPSVWSSPPVDYLPAPSLAGGAPSTFQLILQDESFGYDIVGNPKSITDFRDPAEWPAGAKPVSRLATYDDLYRVTGVTYAYNNGTGNPSTDDTFVSPYAAELAGATNPRQSNNVPTHLLHAQRVKAQTLEYDWLGSLIGADDNTHSMWDRGVGPVSTNGTTTAATNRPYQWKNAGTLANPSWVGTGSAEALAYDEAGNLLDLQTTKIGNCSDGATSCTVRFTYGFDEIGRLNRAKRAEAGATVADLSFSYDHSDSRVLKADQSGATSRYTVYVFGSLELRRATYDAATGDYLQDATTEAPALIIAGQGVGRVTFEAAGNGEPRIGGNRLHVLLNIADRLGSSSIVVDKATSELVERRTYLAYGATESDYRPARWKGFREDYGFTGKEEDIEVGLQYFAKRFLSPYLGRWVSPDPLAVHRPVGAGNGDEDVGDEAADLNLYAYVKGQVLIAVDPLGLFPTRDLVTTASDWKQAFEKKVTIGGKVYDRGGTTRGAAAARTLKLYGETTGSLNSQKPTGKNIWMTGPTKDHPTADKARFIYTQRGGWIDMAHFMFYAARAFMAKEKYQQQEAQQGFCSADPKFSPAELGKQEAIREGYSQERWDDAGSKYSYEDLPSDAFGADFGAKYFDPHSKKTLAEQVDGYLQKLKPAGGATAPNWADVPSGDPLSLPPEPARNETTTPMYTKEK